MEFTATRFTERYDGTVERGTHQYTAICPRTGLLRMRYNDGTVCAVSVIYETQESARAISACTTERSTTSRGVCVPVADQWVETRHRKGIA